jgi:hypothetical protein
MFGTIRGGAPFDKLRANGVWAGTPRPRWPSLSKPAALLPLGPDLSKPAALLPFGPDLSKPAALLPFGLSLSKPGACPPKFSTRKAAPVCLSATS